MTSTAGIAHAVTHRGPLIGHILGISCLILIKRYLTFYFDALTLNYFRFSAGAVVLLSVSMFVYPGELRQALSQRRMMRNLSILAVLACVAQFLLVQGLAYTSATLVGLLRVIEIVLGVLVAYMFFHDERATVRGKMFKAGAVLALIGIGGVILGGKEATIEYSLGSLYTVVGIFAASSATVFEKIVVTAMSPLPAAALRVGIMSIIYAGVSSAWGDVAALADAPWYMTTILFASGAFGLFVSTGLGFITIRNFGVITHRLSRLVVPLLVGVFSYFLLNETLTILQMIFGAVLLAGCYLIIRQRYSLKGKLSG